LASAQHVDPLGVRQHRAFAQRAAGDQAVAAGVHLQREAALHFRKIEAARLGEFACYCGNHTLPHDVLAFSGFGRVPEYRSHNGNAAIPSRS
jgi:hypothetical protein